VPASDELFDPLKAPPPQQEPVFGTHYWCQKLSDFQLQEWSDLAKAQLPQQQAESSASLLSLPQQNQFIPTKFSLKALPPADCDHPLLNCSIKLQITVGKRKVSNAMQSSSYPTVFC
jgi:secreted Zn-dependent insulinase-like peptidase